MPLIILKKTKVGTFEPAYQDGEEWMIKQPPGKFYKANLKSSRNPDHHRKGMALLRLVFNNQDRYAEFEDLRVEFQLKAGWYREHITTKGKLIYVPKSIAFDEMGQEDFENLYRRFIEIAQEHFGFNDELLQNEIAEFG